MGHIYTVFRESNRAASLHSSPVWEPKVQRNLSHSISASSTHGTPQSHLLLGSLKYGSSGSSSAISHAIYLVHGKLEYLCTTKFGEGSPQRTYAEFLNVGVLRLQVILLKTPFTWFWAEVSTPSCCHIANTVPRLTMKILSPLSNLFKWAEKAVIGW